MATYSRELRRGLPRTEGGDPWPPPGAIPDSVAAQTSGEAPAEHSQGGAPPRTPEPAPTASAPAVTESPAPAAPATAEPDAAAGAETIALRRGLPRAPGGEPWPPAAKVTGTGAANTPASPTDRASDTPAAPEAEPVSQPQQASAAGESTARGAADRPRSAARQVLGDSDVPLRRGLPRTPGGEPWPPEGFAPLLAEPDSQTPADETSVDAGAGAAAGPTEPSAPTSAPETQERTVQEAGAADSPSLPAASEPQPAAAAAPAAASTAPESSMVSQPSPAAGSAGTTPAKEPTAPQETKPPREPIMIGTRSLGQWSRLVILVVVGAVLAAGILVLAARGLTTLPGVPEFMERHTGVYEIPDVAEEGLPWWVRWTHYMNFFFMLLIIRTGLLVRQQQKPDAFYTPKKGGKKVSIYLWLHTSVDILWMLNGLIFVVTLFATGHWRRIVPTSWEVFPNALSSLLQYMTLEWPTYQEGWVYYNSLQELMYFTVVFIAAPLAAITGLRMSEWWPKDAQRLNRIYPAPVARALHFPVMLFFVLFLIMHVAMVFATGALKNLNHMFYGAPEPSWMGFWFFAGGLLVAVGAVLAARPLVIAPIASLFGRVSNR